MFTAVATNDSPVQINTGTSRNQQHKLKRQMSNISQKKSMPVELLKKLSCKTRFGHLTSGSDVFAFFLLCNIVLVLAVQLLVLLCELCYNNLCLCSGLVVVL